MDGAGPRGRRMQLGVFRLRLRRPERVYQLDVSAWRRLPRDLHAWPHEHFGSARVPGDAQWREWSYDEVLARFCASARVTFDPPLSNPLEFKLTG